jgi:hypothetical protein
MAFANEMVQRLVYTCRQFLPMQITLCRCLGSTDQLSVGDLTMIVVKIITTWDRLTQCATLDGVVEN